MSNMTVERIAGEHSLPASSASGSGGVVLVSNKSLHTDCLRQPVSSAVRGT